MELEKEGSQVSEGNAEAACLHEWGVASGMNETLQVSHSVEMDVRHIDSLQTRSLRGSTLVSRALEGVASEY